MNKWLVLAIIVVLVAGGAYFYKKQKSAMVKPTMTPSPVTEKMAPSMAVQENVVTLTKDGFSPATLTIKVGVKVTWVNKSGSDATVSSDPHPVHTKYPPLNLGKFSDGSTLSLSFPKAGSYGYHNHMNPSETGTVVVQ